jgi:L,D-transpeptidase ErfK/SrfK
MLKKIILTGIAAFMAIGSIVVHADAKYYGGNLCAFDGFKCIKVKHGDSWGQLFPNKREREIVKRLNRTNLPLRYRSWIVVPEKLKALSNMDLSPFPDYLNTSGKKMVIVNLGLHAFGAYSEDGHLVHWGPVSGGRGWCKDINKPCTTAVGTFRITHKKGTECVSEKFPIETAGGAPMPYCMYYYRGFALHGSTLPGYHASHGCIRLFFDDAEWLNKHFLDVGSKIVVTR